MTQSYADLCKQYQKLKQEWLASHPDATAEQIELNSKRIAQMLGV